MFNVPGGFARRNVHGIAVIGGLIAIMALTIWRGIRLARFDLPLDGHGEQRYFHWAYRDPNLYSLLEASTTRFRDGEILWIVIPTGQYDPEWFRVMATYALSHQIVLGVTTDVLPQWLPNHITAVHLRPPGLLQIDRSRVVRASP